MNSKNATIINNCIESMLSRTRDFQQMTVDFECDGKIIIDDADDASGFSIESELCQEVFGCNTKGYCNNAITKNDIMGQLIVVDSLYSTNINRMRNFALEEICDDIWDLCNKGNGIHTLETFTLKINATQKLSPAIASLFTKSYGYIRGEQAGKAPSLISKYLFLAKIACPTDIWGFPIYDRIANDLMRDMQRFLGIPVTHKKQDCLDINNYIAGLKSIIDVLEINNPNLWKKLPFLRFQILDYFLWHIGKAGKKSYSLLLTKREIQTCYKNGKLEKIPSRIAYWQSIYKKLKK